MSQANSAPDFPQPAAATTEQKGVVPTAIARQDRAAVVGESRCCYAATCRRAAVADLPDANGDPVPHCALHAKVFRILDAPLRSMRAMEEALTAAFGRSPR